MDDYPADWFTADGITSDRVIADPETGRVEGMLARWGQCLRGTGARVCQTLRRESTDLDVWQQNTAVIAGAIAPVGGMALGPAHPDPRRTDAVSVMHELMRPEWLAVLARAHDVHGGVGIAGVIAPEAVERFGSIAAAAAAINRTAWSLHAGPSADRPGVHELWGAVAVTSSGLPQSLAASLADGEPCCDACAAISAAPADDQSAAADDTSDAPSANDRLVQAVADEVERRAAERQRVADLASMAAPPSL